MSTKREIQFPEDIEKIRDLSESLVPLNITDFILQVLWESFSEEFFCAQFMAVDEQLVKQFDRWLDGF